MSKKYPDVYVVIWNGEMLELDSPDAITFTEADARAIIAASPGRRESYSIDRCVLATLLTSPFFTQFGDRLREQIEARNLTPIMLRGEAERQKRAR